MFNGKKSFYIIEYFWSFSIFFMFISGWIVYSLPIAFYFLFFTFLLFFYTIAYSGACSSIPPLAFLFWWLTKKYISPRTWVNIDPGWLTELPDWLALVLIVLFYGRAFQVAKRLGPIAGGFVPEKSELISQGVNLMSIFQKAVRSPRNRSELNSILRAAYSACDAKNYKKVVKLLEPA
ncbi:MAG: hypothetical protein ACE5JO_12645, partial [Candidatus Binatia bacterium]